MASRDLLEPVQSLVMAITVVAASCLTWILGPLSDIRGYDPFGPFIEVLAFGISVWICARSRGVGFGAALIASIVTGLLAVLGLIGVVVVLLR